MDVSCPRCDTLFELDPRQLRPGGATLKCSECLHLFRIDPPTGRADESQRRWMVRRGQAGDILYFSSFDTLHRWIMEQKVGPEDSISRTGQRWTVLESIGEFTPIFQVLASIASLTQGQDVASGPDQAQTLRRKTPAPSMAEPNSGERAESRRRQAQRSAISTVPGRPGGAQAPSSRSTASLTKREERFTPLAIPQAPAGERGGPQTVPMAPHQILEEHSGGEVFEEDASRAAPRSISSEVNDEWTLGELAIDEGERPYQVAPPPRRWPWVLMLLLSVVGVLVVIAFAGGPAGITELIERSGLELRGRDPSAGDGSTDPAELARERSTEALSAARQELRRASAPLIQEAIHQAQTTCHTALEASISQARRAARPAASTLIAAGRRALERGDGARAKSRFKAALEAQPRNVDALIGLGWAYLATGEHDAALSRFNAALVQAPQHGEALIGMGRAERERGNPRAALAAYEDYLRRFPAGPHATIAQFQSEQLRRSLQKAD